MLPPSNTHDYKPSGLLDLPPELRLEIYPYLLTGQHNFQLWPKQRVVVDKTGKSSARTRTYLSRRPDAPNPGISASILRTCKLIYQEASSLLYTSNKFSSHGANIPRFVSQIGSNAQLLRHIELKGVRTGQEMIKVFDALRQTTGLLELVICYDVGTYGLIKHLMPVVRSWTKSRGLSADAKGWEKVLNVMKIKTKEQQAEALPKEAQKVILEELSKETNSERSTSAAK